MRHHCRRDAVAPAAVVQRAVTLLQ
jgi:hypothetical protein